MHIIALTHLVFGQFVFVVFCGVVESSSANNVLFIILASTQEDALDIRFKRFRFINVCRPSPCLFYIYKRG